MCTTRRVREKMKDSIKTREHKDTTWKKHRRHRSKRHWKLTVARNNYTRRRRKEQVRYERCIIVNLKDHPKVTHKLTRNK